jgi:hypothetical protein
MVIFVSAIVHKDRGKIQAALTRQLAEMSECSFPTLLRPSNPLAQANLKHSLRVGSNRLRLRLRNGSL